MAVAVLVCVVVGVASAVWAVRARFEDGSVANGPWTSNENIGSSAAGPYLRAGVAVGGLLALSKSETVYFTAFEDGAGEPLRTTCVYRVEGRDPAARWWSITAYGADHYLIPNEGKRYSVDETQVERGADGGFSIVVGGEPRPGRNWISTGSAGGGPAEPFSLTLRLYDPDPAVVASLATAELPAIVRERCS
ncbi:MAG: DUF1214 domain-containing protein [Thermodesulfobacteriota bacterium]